MRIAEVLRAHRSDRADVRDRGALSLEMLIVFPAVLLVIMMTVHVGLWWHARNTALAAAQLGAESARVRDATSGEGVARTRDFLSQSGGSISGPYVSESRSDATVTIRVTGHVSTMVPGLRLPIDEHAQAAIERVTEPG
ncbi:TadE family protein [Streptomyces xiamenensis]|uniref:TadE family protein n=1 Tax=Streptomyces xiamenensis TaxID=408015 RepID=UPI0036EC1334